MPWQKEATLLPPEVAAAIVAVDDTVHRVGALEAEVAALTADAKLLNITATPIDRHYGDLRKLEERIRLLEVQMGEAMQETTRVERLEQHLESLQTRLAARLGWQ